MKPRPELQRHIDALNGMGQWRRFWYISANKREIDAEIFLHRLRLMSAEAKRTAESESE